MKSIRSFFIGGLILICILILGAGEFFILKYSPLAAKSLPGFSHMAIPMAILSTGVVLSLILGLVFALRSLISYSRNLVFLNKMVVALENTGFAFFAACLFTCLIIFYTCFNIDGSITNLFALFFLIICLLISQIMFLIADVVDRGVDYKKDSDLTI